MTNQKKKLFWQDPGDLFCILAE